jgi:hypothetical protein
MFMLHRIDSWYASIFDHLVHCGASPARWFIAIDELLLLAAGRLALKVDKIKSGQRVLCEFVKVGEACHFAFARYTNNGCAAQSSSALRWLSCEGGSTMKYVAEALKVRSCGALRTRCHAIAYFLIV